MNLTRFVRMRRYLIALIAVAIAYATAPVHAADHCKEALQAALAHSKAAAAAPGVPNAQGTLSYTDALEDDSNALLALREAASECGANYQPFISKASSIIDTAMSQYSMGSLVSARATDARAAEEIQKGLALP